MYEASTRQQEASRANGRPIRQISPRTLIQHTVTLVVLIAMNSRTPNLGQVHMAIDVSVIGKLTDAVEALRNFVDKAAGAEEEKKPEPPTKGAVPPNAAAVQLAKTARQSYQKTARWMLAAFAAVGVLIFGSLPFAAVADVVLTWPNSLFLVGGLLLAVAGIVGAVVAVSLVNEPEDASLGELESDLRTVQKTDKDGFVFKDGNPVIAVSRLRTWWNPRLACRVELTNILHGDEAAAHLGPNLAKSGQPTVTHLIRHLGDLEAQHATLAPAVAEKTVLAEKLPQDHQDLPATKESLAKQQAELAEVDTQLAMYHAHRDLVLAESGVMQLRGRFRLARRILAIAAVLTLFGGTGYALALPGATEKTEQPQAKPPTATPPPAKQEPAYATGLPATVLIHEGTRPARDLPRTCLERNLEAIWIGKDRIPATTGPFTAVITDPTCTGEIHVAAGEGRITLTR